MKTKSKILLPELEIIGITQKSLAEYVGVGHTLLNKYINNNGRNLSNAAMLPIAHMLSLVDKLKATPPPLPTATDKAKMQYQANWCRSKCYPLQKKLDAAKKAYAQGCSLHQVIDGLIAAGQNEAWYQQSTLTGWRYEANKKQKENGWLVQHTLQLAINKLNNEADFWEAAMVAEEAGK